MNLNKNLNRFLPKPIVRDIAGRIAGALFFSFFIYKECLCLQNSYKNMAWLDLLIWFLITTNYSLYVLAFLIRHKPKAAAARLLEFLIPAIVCIQPFLIHLALIISETPQVFPIIAEFKSQLDHYPWIMTIFKIRYQLCPLISQWLIIIGAAIFVTGAFFLLRSFSIFSEARKPVYKGLYKYIRHPLYLGESIWITGLALQYPSILGYIAAFIFITGLRWRAAIEERKIIENFPEYAQYKTRTNAYFPKIKSARIKI